MFIFPKLRALAFVHELSNPLNLRADLLALADVFFEVILNSKCIQLLPWHHLYLELLHFLV
jgi:hypothetical protein